MAISKEEQRYRKALALIDFSDTLRKEYSVCAAPHRLGQINYGKLYRDVTNYGMRKAVLNVADDLKL